MAKTESDAPKPVVSTASFAVVVAATAMVVIAAAAAWRHDRSSGSPAADGARVVLVSAAAFANDAPLIGITSEYVPTDDAVRGGQIRVRSTYVDSVRDAGGIPVVIPAGAADDDAAIAMYLDRLDGLVLIGGRDIPAGFYGEEPHPTVGVIPARRFGFESRLAASWLAGEKPVLGVCLGSQMMTAVSGGSLVQDIPSEVGGGVAHSGGSVHGVEIAPGTRLSSILGVPTLEVNSYHHQATDVPGDGFIVAARSADGVVEAVEMPGERFVLGVQWHPERSADVDRGALFGALVEAARGAEER